MARYPNRNNYRQYYKNYFGIDFGRDYVIHHVNFNRDDNDIGNLLLMPRELHGKYHMNLNYFEYYIDSQRILTDANGCQLAPQVLENFAEVLHEVNLWRYYKETNYRDFVSRG